jgi:hypothetical protein
MIIERWVSIAVPVEVHHVGVDGLEHHAPLMAPLEGFQQATHQAAQEGGAGGRLCEEKREGEDVWRVMGKWKVRGCSVGYALTIRGRFTEWERWAILIDVVYSYLGCVV